MESDIRPKGHRRRRRLIVAVSFAAALAVAASIVGLSRAGSVNTSVLIHVFPHTLTLNTSGTTQGLLASEFTNAGGTVTHVVETISTNTPGITTTASGCTYSGSTITCTIGQVAPGTVQRLISFALPQGTAAGQFMVSITVTFDEGNGTNSNDSVSANDSGTLTSATDSAHKGQCLAGAGSLTTTNGNQKTFLNYPGLPTTTFPCTPGDAGVNNGPPGPTPSGAPSALFGDTSFVEFLAGNGLAMVQITLLNPPQKPVNVTKNNLFFVEYANYPNDLTPTNNGNPVPPCQFDSNGNPVIPPGSGYVSCVVSITNNPGGGLLATLAVQGGSDAGWGTG